MRAFRILGVVLLALVVLAGAALLAFVVQFRWPAPRASYPPPASALEAQRQDLDYFAKLLALDRSFSPAARATAVWRIAELAAQPAALPTAKLHAALMQLMGLADNGHSRMEPLADQGTLLLPLRVTAFAEGFYVMRAAAPYADMLGGRLESIDGMPFDALLPRLESLRGGLPAFRRENAADNIAVQELLYGLGIAAHPDFSVWTVRLPDGRAVTHTLKAVPSVKGETVPSSYRFLSPEPATGRDAGSSAAHPASGTVPESWRDADRTLRLFATGCVQTVRLRSINDNGGQKIASFLAQTEAALKAHTPCGLVVDLRGDSGGDYTKTWHFTHALPDLVRGRIVVLTDARTFSAAITTTAFIKAAAPGRVSIVGEPVGDRLAFFSEGGSACLPNMKVCVDYQRAKHDYARACIDPRQCYWLNWFYPVRVASLQPDMRVPLCFADWNDGRDMAFERAVALAEQRAP